MTRRGLLPRNGLILLKPELVGAYRTSRFQVVYTKREGE